MFIFHSLKFFVTTFNQAVFNGIEESLVQILTPRRRVDILRDVLHAKSQNRSYTITFCGVNGVEKSTNLAKICFWLLENGFRIMTARVLKIRNYQF